MDKTLSLHEALAVEPPNELFLAHIMGDFSAEKMLEYDMCEFAARCMAAAVVVARRTKLVRGQAGIDELVDWIQSEISRRNDIQAAVVAIRGCRGKCGGAEIIKAIADGDVPLLVGAALGIGCFESEDVKRIINEWRA